MQSITNFSEIPYLENGRSFEGADCYGLVRLYYEHILSIVLPDYPGANKGTGHTSPLFITEVHKYFEKMPRKEVQQHDIVLFRMEGERPDHVGVMIDKRRVMQINESHGVFIVTLGRMNKFFYAAYRHRSLL